jgi:hypothetical protein
MSELKSLESPASTLSVRLLFPAAQISGFKLGHYHLSLDVGPEECGEGVGFFVPVLIVHRQNFVQHIGQEAWKIGGGGGAWGDGFVERDGAALANFFAPAEEFDQNFVGWPATSPIGDPAS